MKRILSLTLVLIMLLGLLAGCGTSKPSTGNTGKEPKATDPVFNDQPLNLEDLQPWQELQSMLNRDNETPVKRDHTLLFYMVGSNLESERGFASTDLREMVASGVDVTKTNVVVYTGGSKVWHDDIPSDCNTVLELTATGFYVAAGTENAANTGDPITLCNFLNFAYENYPADKYSLIFWDHGGGSLFGFGSDELFQGDALRLNEIEAAMANSPFANHKLEFVGFDACLMATLETAATFAPYARYLVASEELEPGSGWDYAALQAMNSGSTESLISQIISSYEASMKASRWKPEYSLSCMDLSKLNGVISATDNLFSAARQGVLDGNYSAIAQARLGAKNYAVTGVKDMSSTRDMVDLSHAAQLLGTLYPTQADALRTAVSNMIVTNVTNLKNTNGVSFYYPYYNTSLYINGGWDLYSKTATAQSYKDFMQVYMDMRQDGKLDVQWESEKKPEANTEYMAFQFSQDEIKNIGRTYCNIFKATNDGKTYMPILTDYSLSLDSTGKMLIPYDPSVVVVRTDMEIEPGIFHVSHPTEEQYVSPTGVLMISDNVLTGGIEPVQISLVQNGNSLNISSILSRDETQQFYARNDVNVDQWNEIAFLAYDYHLPTSGMLPYEQWDKEDYFMLVNYRYHKDFSFETMPLSQLEGTYYVQICVEDTTGNLVYSTMELLRENTPYTVETVKTEKGTLTYWVYQDHAELISCEGEDETIVIPETIGGQPVTVIGEEAAVDANRLTHVTLPKTVTRIENKAFHTAPIQSVNLPEGLTYIGSYAFSSYAAAQLQLPQSLQFVGYKAFTSAKLESITLPRGISFIAGDAFSACSKLQTIQITGSTKYQSVDGVLYTADGKTLVAFPGGKSEYVIPSGVETIGYGAFSGNWTNLTRVTIPEGVVTIENMAFYGCEKLTELTLPDSVEYIGHSAFGTDVGIPKSDTTKVIKLGKNISFIGIDAFSCFNLTQYQVDPENLYYSSSDNGCLLNASGTQLISTPYATQGVFQVPMGVCLMDWHSMYDCDGITELVLSDTVAAIDSGAFLTNSLQKLTIGKGLVYWPNQEDCQTNIAEIVIHSENPFFGKP